MAPTATPAATTGISKYSIGYKHQSASECQAFIPKLKSKARADGADTLKVYKHAVDETAHNLNATQLANANEALYDVIIDNLGNDNLVRTLAATYKNDGIAALRYIRGCWATAGNDNKESDASRRYNAGLVDLKSGVTAFELQEKFNDLSALRADLDGTSREVSNERYCSDIIDMVKALSFEHKMETQSDLRSLSEDERDEPSKVQTMLEGVVTSINGDREREREGAARKALAVGPAANDAAAQNLILAAATVANGNGPLQASLLRALQGTMGDNGASNNANYNNNLAPCDECGLRHWIAPGETCHTKLLAEGKDVPGWDAMDPTKQQRMQMRADEYNKKGPFKDRSAADKAAVLNPIGGGRGRGNGGKGGGGRGRGGGRAGAALMALLGGLHLQPTHQFTLPPISMMRANAVTAKYGTAATRRIIVDTGNLTGKHLICNKDLFSTLDETAAGMPVKSASDDVSTSAGDGSCTFIALDNFGTSPASWVSLDDCSYVPGFGVNLLSVQKLREQGARVDLDANTVTFASGATISFDSDFTMSVVPTPNGAYPAIVSRGKYGPTRIGIVKLTPAQQALMDLWSARLNGATALTLRNIHKITEGAPSILRLANDHNALSVPRLMATGKRMNAPARTEGPIATKPGQITSIDWWDGPCTGLLGSTGLFALSDNGSGAFRAYPAASKGEAAPVTDLYYRDAAHDGVVIDPGSVVFSDNEKMLTSRKFEDQLSELRAVHEFSAEYEPWGNGGVESVNRYLPAMMRAAHIKGGAPDEFWEFSAVDCAHLLNTIMERDGVSLHERWCGKRRSIAGRKTLFCRALARKPVPWRGGKLDAQQIDGVYLGKARRKQGYYVWSPEYGIVTSSNVTFFESVFPFKNGMTYTPHASTGHSTGLRILTGLDPANAPRAADEGDRDGANLPGDYVPPPPRANDDPPPADPPAHRTRSAHDLSDVSMSDLANATSARRQAYLERALNDSRIGMQEYILRSPAGAISGRDAALLDSIAASASVAPGGDKIELDTAAFDPKVRAALMEAVTSQSNPTAVHEAFYEVLSGGAHATASAAPGGAYIPLPKEKLSDLDETVQAMWEPPDKKEIDGILEWAEIVKIADLPKGTKIIGCTVQRSIKRDGTLKTRVCVQGFGQIWGLHYDRSHSPCMMHPSLRTIVGVAACTNATLECIDFTQAYTQSALKPEEYIYMRPPPGYERDKDGNEVCWLVTRSLYGMVQSGRNWYYRLREWLVSHGFEPSFADPCVYKKKTAAGVIILGVYVDDMAICSTDPDAKREFITELAKDFDFTDQGPLTEMLGIEFGEIDGYLVMSLGKYIDKLADRYLGGTMANRKEHKTPASPDLPKLVLAAIDSDAPIDPELVSQYRSLVGALLFAALTVRADISYAVGMLSRALNKPDSRLLDEARRVLHYLVLTRDIGPRYKRGSPIELTGMTDSDWAVIRSTSGFAFFLAGAIIAYMSKKQATIAMSSTEAEIMAASQAGLEAVYLRSLLADMGYELPKPTDLYVDNKGAIDMSRDYISNERTKHIERRHLKIRELVEDAVINVKYVASHLNVADIFTKPLDRKQFQNLRAKLFNL